jgi:hypothetical protein
VNKSACLLLLLDRSRTHQEAELFLVKFQMSSEESNRMDFVEPACDHSTYVFCTTSWTQPGSSRPCGCLASESIRNK